MSLFVCPTHGLHHGAFCCDQPQEWWDGTFADEASAMNEPDAPDFDEPDFITHVCNVLDDYKDGTLESRDEAVEAIIQHPVARVALRMKLVGHKLDGEEAPHP